MNRFNSVDFSKELYMSTVGLPECLLNLSDVSLADSVRNGNVMKLSRLNHAHQVLLVLELHDWHMLVFTGWKLN